MTTASKTGFAMKKLETHGYTFWFDGNQKITAGNGTFEEPAANAFSLPQIQSCPFRTPICAKSCYVHNLEEHQPDVHAKYVSNYEQIQSVLYDSGVRYHVQEAFASWIITHAPAGFRWHVSGDVFSERYALWISYAARMSDVPQWIYTRSFHLLDPLLGIPNLTVNLSADKDNYWLARRTADKHNLRVCYLTVDGEVPDDLREGDVVFPDYALRGVGMRPHTFREGSDWWNGLSGAQKKMVCPVDAYGKSENVRCGPCRKCLD